MRGGRGRHASHHVQTGFRRVNDAQYVELGVGVGLEARWMCGVEKVCYVYWTLYTFLMCQVCVSNSQQEKAIPIETFLPHYFDPRRKDIFGLGRTDGCECEPIVSVLGRIFTPPGGRHLCASSR